MLPFVRGPRGRKAQLESVIARAQALPPGDYRRTQIISELATVDFKASYERAAALIRTADPGSMTLGAEIFDQLFVGMREGRRLVRQAEELLRELCRTTQDPEVLSAALHPYAQLSSNARPLLYELLEHPDGRVRSTAVQLIATSGGEFADDRQVDALIELLEGDPDSAVRERAAEGLEFVLACYAYVPQRPRITGILSGLVDDPTPAIRASALACVGALDIDTAVKSLLDELFAAKVAWQFVDWFNRVAQVEESSADLRAEAHAALRRLKQLAWAEDVDPARFPAAHERAEMLAKAISATGPARVDVADPGALGWGRGPRLR
jgi:hypothetical protein